MGWLADAAGCECVCVVDDITVLVSAASGNQTLARILLTLRSLQCGDDSRPRPWMLFPVWFRRTFSAIIRYLPSGPTRGRFELWSPSWRRYGLATWRGSENSRKGLVGEIISPLWLRRVRVRVVGTVRVTIGLGVGFGLG